ncbi:STAS/SEC14 domain-containing protein [Niveibacterium sp. 24ML]|uniref:STAS/SEC14 domain-containing protein n=1 Tax=Niveibacterium sp. 24ML TaxID=2985512 RepID=UPI00226F08BC|nr:STAS/SEC14 domain-containing protein [Niveibacterium sp. 24ML]MCX9158435.1 STAS/SEC14 domain-containing protein [Niveibacterium sp. 24ML]
MITAELRDNCVEAVVFGELTLADFRQFESQVEAAIATGAPLRAWVDLRQMDGLTLDAAIEDFRFARRHKNADGRIAVVTDDDLDSIGAWVEQSLVNAEIRLFDDETMARAWLAGEAIE